MTDKKPNLNLTQEQLDFLKEYKFYYQKSEDYNSVKYDHVWGYVPALSRHNVEFYNMESVEELIRELKENTLYPTNKGSILVQRIDDLYQIDGHELQRIEKSIDRKTRELKVREPVTKAFEVAYKRLVVSETDDYYSLVGRYTGEFGNGEQYIRNYYKSKKSALKYVLPVIDRNIEENKNRIILLEELKNTYIKDIGND